MGGYAWVTLATNDSYSLGALVLAHSLRRVGTKYELACLITPGVTSAMREKLAAVFSLVQEVNVLDSKDEANLALLARPELGITFTKLHCWRLTQYEKCVFVDADTLVIRNCDELFEREELSAAPDVGWPDCFNSGVFVFRPSQETFASITAFAIAKGSFDGGDQGLLNMYFSDWATKDISKHLPFIYNMCSTATYSYLPAFKQFGEEVRIIHFIGITKPWLQYFDTLTGIVQPPAGSGHLQPLLQLWWNIFCEKVHPQLSASMATSTLAPIYDFAPLLRTSSVPETPAYPDTTRGRDSYSQASDFSEFKDPWEEYYRRNKLCSSTNDVGATTSENAKNYYHGTDQFSVVHQIDRNTSQLEHDRQFPHEQQQHSPFASPQIQQRQHAAHNQHATSRIEDWGYPVQHTEYQYSEPRYHDERHNEHKHDNEQHCQHLEQRHEQFQRDQESYHHEQHQSHGDEQRRQNERQSRQQDDHRDDANDRQVQQRSIYEEHPRADESYSIEARGQESWPQGYPGDQVDHQNADRRKRNEYDSPPRIAQSSHAASNERSSSGAANKQIDARRIDSPLSPPFTPCTDLRDVAARSDPNVTEHLDDANAGIAGALAQMTLGEARSEQQKALEEHMRKQSWEQGQIDYMGRDSFENIWKKICETLSLAPTPPKEDTAKGEESAAAGTAPITAAATTPVTAEPVVQTVASVETDKPAVEADKGKSIDTTGQEQSLVCKVPEEKLPAQSTVCEIARSPEQKEALPMLPGQVSVVAAETAATTVSSGEPIQAPAPKPPVEESPIAMSPPATLETTASTDEGGLLVTSSAQPPTPVGDASQPAAPQAPQMSTCPAVCKLPARAADQDAPTSTEDKPETPVLPTTFELTTQLMTAPIGTDSPQMVAAAVAPLQEDSAKRAIDVTQPLTIDPSERHAEMLLAASEISTVSPVPIQVAESVLQAEPKESVSGSATASDQAIAATVTAVQESTDVASAAIAAEPQEGVVRLNGSACEIEKCESAKEVPSDSKKESASPSEAKSVPEKKTESGSSVVVPGILPEIPEKVAQSAEQVARMETEATGTEPTAQVAETVATKTKSAEQVARTEVTEGVQSTEQIAKTEATTEKSPEQAAEITGAIAKPETTETIAQAETRAKERATEQTTSKVEVAEEAVAAAKSSSEVGLESPITEQSPPATIELTEEKLLDIPSTPTVIEATPPTSPSTESVQEAEGQERTAKKSLKKSDSADGTDGEGDKKGAKKAVKKVTKKPKLQKPEEAAPTAEATAAAAAAVTAADSAKAKKTVKVTKKTSAKSLETDTTVPETPPPPPPPSSSPPSATTATTTSDVPVPPKRKTKSTTSAKGTAGKKPETEE